MAKFRSIKNSFLGGMISPTATGRTDLPQYPHSCELLQNFIPRISGGVYKRPGTIRADAQVTSSRFPANITTAGSVVHSPPRMVPFIVSDTQSYVLPFYYASDAAPGSEGMYDGITSFGSPVTNTGGIEEHPFLRRTATSYTSTGYEDDETFQFHYCQSGQSMFITHPNYEPRVAFLNKYSTSSLDLAAMHTAWGYLDATFSNTGQVVPYLNQNTTATTLAISATGTGVGKTLTASSNLFDGTFVGTYFKVWDGTKMASYFVTADSNSVGSPGTTVTVTCLATANDTSAHATWWESAWSNRRGWPKTCCIFQGRLVMAGTTHQPDTIWFSQTGNFEVFSVLGQTNTTTIPQGTVLVNGASITVTSGTVIFPDDSSEGNGKDTGPTGIQPFRITLAENSLDQIQWLSPDKELLIGTNSQEWLASPVNGSFDVANSLCVVQSHYGSDDVQPCRIGYELCFVDKSKCTIQAYQYNYIDASFFAEPIHQLFDQFPAPEKNTKIPGRRKIRQMQWDQTRETLWVLDSCGNFFGCTRNRKLQITMWHIHQFGGYDSTVSVNVGVGSGGTKLIDPAYALYDGQVVSFAITPNPLTGVNDIYLCIKRTINGVGYWQYEKMCGKEIGSDSAYGSAVPTTDGVQPVFVDHAYILADAGSASTKTYTVGTTYEGKSLTGTYYDATYGLFKISTGAVASGVATITSSVPSGYGTASNTLTLGYAYDSIIKTTRLEVGSVIGTAQGALKRIARVFLRFFKTMSCQYGSAPGGEDINGLLTVNFNAVNQNLSSSVEFFTGDKKQLMPSTYDRDAYVYLKASDPLPCSVVAIVSEGEEFD